MDVARYRAEFPAVAEAGRVHLNNCSAAPIPERALDARRACERVWIEEPNPWPTWLQRVDEARARFADLVGADAEEIAVTSCATEAFARVASALAYDAHESPRDSEPASGPPRARDEVVVSDLEFPTVPQFWRAQGKRGAKVRVAESPDGVSVPPDAYAEVITDDTALVCTSHARSFTGSLLDVRAVADAVHDRGGLLFLDAYQSAGVVPIDVDAMGVDLLVSGTLKFLCGGPGIALLYVDSDLVAELEPASLGWFGVAEPFAFETEEFDYAPDARRFELGAPPATAAYQAGAGMDLIAEVGVDRIRERVVEHTRHLLKGARGAGFDVRTPAADDRRGGVVNVQVADRGATAEALVEEGFNVSTRAGGVRLSPHFYNTEAEVARAVAALAEHGAPP
jgi:selenocysteine lyase/cysteine desulfurase